MKKTTFLKTLLMAVGLCMGGNAWADVTPFSESYSSTSTTTGWTTGTGGRYTPVILNDGDDYYLSVSQDERNNNGATVTGTVVSGKAAAGDDFTITFDLKLSSSTNQSPTSFTIKDAAGSGTFFSLTATGTWATTWSINGSSTQVTLPNSNMGNASNTIADVTWCSYKITRSGEDTYLTITNKETSAVIFSQAAVSGSSATGGLGNMVFASSRYYANFAIDNIVVREVIPADIPATYTATFTDNTSGKNISGTTTIYSDSERTSEIANGSLEDGETYYYTATQTNYYDYQGSFTVDGANPSVSFSMTRYPSYTINAVAGGTVISTIASGYAAKDASYSTYIPKAFLYKSQYYILDDDDNEDLTAFHLSYTMGNSDEVKQVNYTLDPSVIYYAEYEDILTDKNSYEYFPSQSSKGTSRCIKGTGVMKTSMGLSSAGVYNVTISGGNRDGSHTTTMELKQIDSEDNVSVGNVITQNFSGGQWIGEMSAITLIPAGSELYIANDNGDGNAKFAGDYIIVRKLYDVNNEENIIGAVDYTTADRGATKDLATLNNGDVYKVTFQNRGSSAANKNNFLAYVKNGGDIVATMYSDWYDYFANSNANFTNGYASSMDGGLTLPGSCWTNFFTDMANAQVELTFSYSGGTLSIAGTATNNSHIYYYNYAKSGLVGDVTVGLSVCKAWIEILSESSSAAVSGTLSSTGYSSLAVPYALNFSGATGLTAAYVVTKTTNEVAKLTSVDAVPAGTPVILKGSAGAAYSIPVIATADAPTTNYLSAAVVPTGIAANEAYILQSGELHLVTAASTVPAGKAYLLDSNVPAGARSLAFSFEDDETTGISDASRLMDNGEMKNDNFFNLNGQRIEKPVKGLYIVNGKKVVVK